MTKAAFHAWITDPGTGPRLSALLAEHARVDAEDRRVSERRVADRRVGPGHCCSDFAIVTTCDGLIDTWACGICETTWTAPCADAEAWRPEP